MNWESKTASNVTQIKPSGIRKFFDIAAQVKDVLSLSIGEPDFAAPDKVLEAMKTSLDHKETSYTANSGMIELRESIAAYFSTHYGVDYDPKDEILVTVGVSEGLTMALLAYTEPGDEVLIPDPAYVAYPAAVEVAGGKAVFVPTYAKDDFKLTVQSLEKVVTPKTKAIVIGYPNNPTGTAMTAEELLPIAEFVKKHDLVVMADEIYCELVYGDVKFTSFAKLPDMRQRTIVFNGFSKAWAMTGMRLGYICAPREGLAPILKLHQYAIMCANTQAQFGGITALKECDEEVQEMRQEYDRRRKVIYKGLCDMGLPVFEPKGAFYIFPDIRSTGMTSSEFCEKLVQEEEVAVVPGSAFGDNGEGFVRISYAASMETIEEAIKRMARFVKKYQK
ncbi:aromatic amino acid aminotransferase [Megasphaera cerevisiae DSM 20462]|uniref:Aminotransferase n=1 Tax=Megasphaera cerevisiae DSM 20462 TaxID=1122219 RepID=A0A0J6WSQ4_9FIRM|nr:aminotransferase class I/II-fold pyridoxal phosphate-dependent enzyme [Megasphaera cerevisiae]KMO86530.1 aromatic amino acid aminotransferase [Megasphaera cerevisiae DSM 20462]MCI1749819.1 aminotransferase class I/II-fold pyridoxal phosphate-dependent enzyme [Megasphaera cerevisiae]OKY54875.1 aromatic amino acid aminotransferase [Megasphaera cerevisiae]SJZ92120.1 aminotransferase [Megasphaera cerevisiae DSM 20462]